MRDIKNYTLMKKAILILGICSVIIACNSNEKALSWRLVSAWPILNPKESPKDELNVCILQKPLPKVRGKWPEWRSMLHLLDHVALVLVINVTFESHPE